MALCSKCAKRKTCRELCPRAERYASRQHVRKKEKTFTDAKIFSIDGVSGGVSFDDLSSFYTLEVTKLPCLTAMENQIVSMVYLQRKTYSEVARALSGGRGKVRLNQNAVKHRLTRARQKIMSFYANSE